jgi:O-antigen ligase
MSSFHNSRNWERLALSWHVFGIIVSVAGFVSATAAMGIIFALRAVIVGFLPELYLCWLWAGVLGLIIWAAGIFFHLWAAFQHIDHMKELPSYDGN